MLPDNRQTVLRTATRLPGQVLKSTRVQGTPDVQKRTYAKDIYNIYMTGVIKHLMFRKEHMT